MIEMYSTNCPKCRVLAKRYRDAGIVFDLIEDEGEVLKKAKEFNIQEVPFVIVDGELYRFTDASGLCEVAFCDDSRPYVQNSRMVSSWGKGKRALLSFIL